MQFKLFAVTLLGACVLQVALAHSATNDVLQDRGLIDDAINKAKEAIKKLTEFITEKVNDALKTLDDLKDKVQEQVDKAIDAVTKQLKDIIGKASETIQQIIDKASELGVDITKCVSNNEDRFQQLFESLLADEVSCVTNELKQAMTIIDESLTVIQNLLTAITSLPGRLAACKTSLTCIGGVLADVTKLTLQLPIEIAKKVTQATEFVAGLTSRLQVCAATQLARAGIATAEIIADVAKCALDEGVGFIA